MQIASETYLVFLDSKTPPKRNWLSCSFVMLGDFGVAKLFRIVATCFSGTVLLIKNGTSVLPQLLLISWLVSSSCFISSE